MASQSAYKPIELDSFDNVLGRTSTEVSSVALGGKIVAVSDEWFAPATDLLKTGPATSMKGQFGPAGALFDGWETRRHNTTYDWVIVRLGPAAGASIVGFDVDTANFNGNEAPEVEIFGIYVSPAEEKDGSPLDKDDPRWTSLLPRSACKPSSRHLYALDALPSEGNAQASPFTHIKLHMIPDGGIARFRVYGSIPPPPIGLGVNEIATAMDGDGKLNVLDLAHVMNGGRVVYTSDQHFGVGPNVLLPGRGKDMGDGWETKRSRSTGHRDWLVIKLGEPGLLNYAEIDTAHFLGNFPESVELHAITYDGACPPHVAEYEDPATEWVQILPRVKMTAGQRHFFGLTNVDGRPFTHVRVTMHPDGGIKRVRIHGRRAAHLADVPSISLPPVSLPIVGADKDLTSEQPKKFANLAGVAGARMSSWFGGSSGGARSPSISAVASTLSLSTQQHGFLGVRHLQLGEQTARSVKASVLNSAAFATYGDVIASPQALGEPDKPYKSVNQGTAQKYEALSDVGSSYPREAQAQASIHVYRCTPPSDLSDDAPFEVKVLERHQFTKQAFIPMANQSSAASGYLVIVAKNGKDDLPDVSTLAAFTATTEQGIAYAPGVWHHPMIALGTTPTDFAVIVHESASQPTLNCDEVFWDKAVARVESARVK